MVFLFRNLFAFAVALGASTGFAATSPVQEQDVDYGQMYVLQKHEIAPQSWQAGLAYTYGFSNPYLAIHGAQLNLTRRLSDYLSLGVSPTFYATANKEVASQLASELGLQGVQTVVYQPQYDSYLMIGLTPLSGMLNWFSASAVSFDFVFLIGSGFSKYKQDNNPIPSFRLAAMPQVMLTHGIGVTGGVQLTWDRFAANDWQNRIDTILGMIGRF